MSPTWWLVSVAVGFLVFGLNAELIRRDLVRGGARPRAYRVLWVSIALLVVPPLLALSPIKGSVSLAIVIAVLILAPIVLIRLFPGQFISLTGGPLPRWGLARDAGKITLRWDHMTKADEITEEDETWLRDRSAQLERWRSPETSELIDLYQEKIRDMLESGGDPQFAERVEARNARIQALLVDYWKGTRFEQSGRN